MTSRAGSARRLSVLYDNIILRLVLYYALLLTIGWLTFALLPAPVRSRVSDALAPLLTPLTDGGVAGGGGLGSRLDRAESLQMGAHYSAWVVVAAVMSSFLLALPVSWVYMFTRQRKGYSQSVVHSLVLLPVVVAGVVVLVRNSLALAFSLAGIVAAVRFRNTLDDSKDAVFIFFMTALGLSAAVKLDVAAVMSVLFIVVVLILWYTDFARMPPSLEGVRAQRRLERAIAIANRTSQFVARLDREVLESLAPQQLDALEERLKERRKDAGGGPPRRRIRFDTRLRVETHDEVALRTVIDPLLETMCKRWRYAATTPGPTGGLVVEYELKLRKEYGRQELLHDAREQSGPLIVSMETVEL